MAYITRKTPADTAKTKTELVFADIKGVDFRKEDTGERRSPDSVNMYRDKSGAWITHPGFRRLGDFEGVCYGMYRFKEKVLLHIEDKLYIWENFPTEFTLSDLKEIRSGFPQRKVKAVAFGGRLIFADGSLACFDGDAAGSLCDDAFVPQTWMSKAPDASVGEAYQQRNLLTSYFVEGFVSDGSSKKYVLSLKELDSDEISAWSVSGDKKTEYKEGEDFTADRSAGTVTFSSALPLPDITGIENVYIKAAKRAQRADKLLKCEEIIAFDGRLFLSGSESESNAISWSGVGDASYFGEIMYTDQAGGENAAKALQILPDGNLLCIKQSGDRAISVWSAKDTGIDKLSETYVGVTGNSTKGTFSPFSHTVFVDDNVFMSENGLSALSKNLNVAYERAIEHRSTLIDAKLMTEDLKNVHMAEFGGYLYMLFPSGHIYIADSSQKTTSVSSCTEYEWAYLSDIGVYKGQYAQGEECIGGEFSPALCIYAFSDEHLLFGGDGFVCMFNFDILKNSAPAHAYHFNNRSINEYVKTPFSWFSHMSRYKKLNGRFNSLYLMSGSAFGAKIMYRTDRLFFSSKRAFEVQSSIFDFGAFDFGDMDFSTYEQQSVSLKKIKAGKFRRLQLLLQSRGFKRPLAVHAVFLEAAVLDKKI